MPGGNNTGINPNNNSSQNSLDYLFGNNPQLQNIVGQAYHNVFTPDESTVSDEVSQIDSFDPLSKGYSVDNETGDLTFNLPDYGYDAYITDISNWQKQKVSFGAEPGWYFFKVFFNFNTNYGLLGGIMSTINGDSPESILASTNSAFGYLKSIIANHKHDKIPYRMLALTKFSALLKDISLRTPWIFNSISGLNTINSNYVKDFDKDKALIIGLSNDSVDSRIGTLLDLYKYACFDPINCKEIIPANLRKFEMSIIVYHMPLTSYHTKALVSKENAVKSSLLTDLTGLGKSYKFDGVLPSKRTSLTTDDGNKNTGGFDNLMSFKLFTFLNCEIEYENFNDYYTDGMSNEQPFQLGKNQFKIKYDRVYEHRMNEWSEMMFGSDGVYYNGTVPSIFDKDDVLNTLIDPESLLINYPGAGEQNVHIQRLNALQKRWEGKQTIMDYTRMLIGKYYNPKNISVFPPAEYIITKGMFGKEEGAFQEFGTGITDWYYNVKNSIKNGYNNFLENLK